MKRVYYKYIIVALLLIVLVTFLKSILNFKESMLENKKYNYNVIFAGTVRNCEKYINNILKHIDICGEKFNNYILIIYENDSNDKTRTFLNENKKDNYYYILEDNVKESKRTVRLENGRNKIIDKMNELNINNSFDYLIMLDMDDVNDSGKFVETIDTCFKYENWDALMGNQQTKYYDIWALREKNTIDYDCWRELNNAKDENQKSNINNIITNTHYKKNGLVEVDSAFGGIAIYKISSIKDCRYKGEYPNGDEMCEHVNFNKCIKKKGGKLFINTEFYTS